MTDGILKPWPKKLRAPKRVKPALKRTKMRTYNAKRKGSSFPKQRDPEYCGWVVTTKRCVGLGLHFVRRVSLNDEPNLMSGLFRHICWGEFTPAHVGKHRAKGAPDRGAVVCMCQALHDYYDNRRRECNRVLSERVLASIASGYGLQYVETGGGR